MSKADELLNSLSEDDISLQLANPETEPHIVIGEDRVISVPKELQRIAVQYDHDVETVTFDCPRYWDDLDMSKLNIYINYMRKDRYIGCYKATDIAVDGANSNIMHFNWKISRNVSEVVGELKFLVCIKKSDAEGYEVNHWNSELNTEMYISQGLEAEESIFDAYPDIISQWEDEVNAVKQILLDARDSGELDGATFTPSVDEAGNLSWTNDKGRENPATVNIKGYSPSVSVKEITGGKQLIIIDYNGSKTVDILDGKNGTNGVDGYSPSVSVKEIAGGKQLTIIDRNGSKTVDILDGTNGTDGIDGYSPSVSVKEITGGKQLTIIDHNGSKTVDILDGKNGTDGVDGYSPRIVVRDVAGGKELDITDSSGTQTVRILNGVNGTDGIDGENGYSPTVVISTIDGGHRLVVTDTNGSQAFDVMDGTDGQDGAPGTNGADGVSPVVTVTNISGGHRVTITDKNGAKSFDVMDGTTEISDAVKDYISTYMYIGEAEPTSGPVLWFDTTPV